MRLREEEEGWRERNNLGYLEAGKSLFKCSLFVCVIGEVLGVNDWIVTFHVHEPMVKRLKVGGRLRTINVKFRKGIKKMQP